MNIDKVPFDFLITEDMKALNINTNHHNSLQLYWQTMLKLTEWTL